MYHELVFHLDLCILAYHQYSQALIWPFDPYYEQAALVGSDRRTNLMRIVRRNFTNRVDYRGPGGTQNWATNEALDPIIFRYNRLYPWSPSFCRPLPGEWLIYKPPTVITDRINTVWMVSYCGDDPNRTIRDIDLLNVNWPQVQQINENPAMPAMTTDHLYGFEGGTGCIKETPVSLSHMGIVLDRDTGGGNYEVHIAFRGSRSGSAGRAASKGLYESGNPDWVTDMDFRALVEDEIFTAHGGVCRGFSRAIKSCIPTLLRCFKEIHLRRGRAPQNIYVTGHSLGGALATQFATAAVVGARLGPNGSNLPDECGRTWPWKNLRLVTFSAPVAGDDHFAKNFNSKVYCRRVLLGRDPITQELIRNHVGAEVHISAATTAHPLAFSHHDPSLIRQRLIRKIQQWDGSATAPAQSPWNTYASFGAMCDAEPYLQDPEKLRAMLGVYNAEAQSYVECIKEMLGSQAAYRRHALQSTIRNKIDSVETVTQYMTAHPRDQLYDLEHIIEAMQKNLSGDLGKFLGLILILTELSRDRAITLTHIKARGVLNRITGEM